MRPSVVYRCYDRYGDLLYVGSSCQWASRLSQHDGNAPAWWAESVNIMLEHFPSTVEAAAAEEHAIATEGPRFNRSIRGQRRTPEQRDRHHAEALECAENLRAHYWTDGTVVCAECGHRPHMLKKGVPRAEQACPRCGLAALRVPASTLVRPAPDPDAERAA